MYLFFKLKFGSLKQQSMCCLWKRPFLGQLMSHPRFSSSGKAHLIFWVASLSQTLNYSIFLNNKRDTLPHTPYPFFSPFLPFPSHFSPPLFSHPVCLHVWNAKKTLWLCWQCWESVSSCLVINGKENKSWPKEFGFWTLPTLFITQKACQGGKPLEKW